MIRDLFLDLDDTLLDFGEAERHGILRTLRELARALQPHQPAAVGAL